MIKRLKYLIGYIVCALHWSLLFICFGLIHLIPIFWLTWLFFNWFPIGYITKILDRITFQEDFWYDKWIENYHQ